jgi:cytochrome c1
MDRLIDSIAFACAITPTCVSAHIREPWASAPVAAARRMLAGFAGLAAIPLVLWLQQAERRSAVRLRGTASLVAAGVVLVVGGCDETGIQTRFTNLGDPQQGAADIERMGYGSCHIIPGIPGARGLVGPPLDHMGKRVFIAGLLHNTPANMVTWLRDPQKIVPGNAMPDMGLSEEQARDVTAYLYTLD